MTLLPWRRLQPTDRVGLAVGRYHRSWAGLRFKVLGRFFPVPVQTCPQTSVLVNHATNRVPEGHLLLFLELSSQVRGEIHLLDTYSRWGWGRSINMLEHRRGSKDVRQTYSSLHPPGPPTALHCAQTTVVFSSSTANSFFLSEETGRVELDCPAKGTKILDRL